MRKTGIVEIAEMLSVVCQYGSTGGVCKRQYIFVWNAQAGQVRLGYGQYVVFELSQCFYGWVRKVLVCEEAGQRLSLLILSELFDRRQHDHDPSQTIF